jgi:uncharacterized 2Fe-2S/4Fe-4S cluster protein (DUF4445 family)
LSTENEGVRVFVEGLDSIEANYGDNLGLILAKNGVILLPCGGRGVCGQCLVRVEGPVSPPTDSEVFHDVLKYGLRLACQVKILGDVRVSPLLKLRRLTTSALIRTPVTVVDPIFKVVDLEQSIRLDIPVLPLVFNCRGPTNYVVVDGFGVVGSIPKSCKGDEKVLLVDLGTTKIEWWLVNSRGDILREGVVVNPQISYGTDIITRLTKALESEDVFEGLRRSVREVITKVVDEVGCVVLCGIAGNSVMTGLFLGMPLRSLALKPYEPPLLGPFIDVLGGCVPCFITPLIGGYVGGDALADLTIAEELNSPTPYLIIDLGTNTEVVLVVSRDPPTIYVTSAPAGPAFERHILGGAVVAVGGISKVKLLGFNDDGSPKFEVIGEPTGLLGSGVVSLVAELLRGGVIDRKGRIVKGFKNIQDVKGVVVCRGLSGREIIFTQHDIREFQKAVSAVRTGWTILLEKAGIRPEELKRVYIAGSFGSSIDVEDSLLLGLIPPVDKDRVVIGGNMVLPGLRLLIFNKDVYRKIIKLREEIRHIHLEREPEFTKLWVKNLEFINPYTTK